MQTTDGWTLAVELESRWLRERSRIDWLLENHADALGGIERARCQELLSGAVRHHSRLEAAFAHLLRRVPRPRLRAILHIAGAEIIENTTAVPAAIVDFAVEKARELCSKAESGMVNAVLRKAVPGLRQHAPDPMCATPATLALHFSHPVWLVERWIARFGRADTTRLLEWDQTPAEVHARLAPGTAVPDFLEPTPWPGFHRMKTGRWPDLAKLIEAGTAYVQDPATRIAPGELSPQPGSAVMDLCAAPGGKALQLAGMVGHGGCVVCVEKPGPRIARLEQNAARFSTANPGGARIEIMAVDALALDAAMLRARDLPSSFGSVLVDAPCTNTGVLRHRIDARWRLEPGDVAAQSVVQLKLLRAASSFVAPGGSLVYSTCSLDAGENEDVVNAFLADNAPRFSLVRSIESRPWETGHDGAAVFLLRRG